jgi:hypothetical protein
MLGEHLLTIEYPDFVEKEERRWQVEYFVLSSG